MEIYLWFLIFKTLFCFSREITREKEKVLVLIGKCLVGIAAAFISCWLFVLLIKLLGVFYNINPTEIDMYTIYVRNLEVLPILRIANIGIYLFVAEMQKHISKFLNWFIGRIKQKLQVYYGYVK